MKRRGFLGLLAAAGLVKVPVVPELPRDLPCELRSPYPSPESDSLVDALNQALRQAYPPGCFEDVVESYSPFYRSLKRMAEHEDRAYMGGKVGPRGGGPV